MPQEIPQILNFATMPMSDYLRYYFLEKYLFDDVHRNFEKNNTLTNEQFMAIIIWKSNRQKTNVVAGIIAAEKTVETLMRQVADASKLEKINLLTEIGGVGIPVASAILTVCYPDTFTVVDYRSCASLAKILAVDPKTLRKQLGGDPVASPNAYLAYVDRCKSEATNQKSDLRTYDQFLWGMDFYEGEDGLKDLAARLP